MTRAHLAQIHAVETAGNRLCHSALLKSRMVSQTVNLPLIDRAVFRESAVDGGAVSDHMLAVMGNAVSAGLAASAIAIRVNADPLSDLKFGYLFSHFGDHAGELMSQDGGRRYFRSTLVSFINMYVCSAYAACLYLDQHILWSYLWHLMFFHSQIMLPIKNCTFHCLCLLFFLSFHTYDCILIISLVYN